jgi:hypothetical protein
MNVERIIALAELLQAAKGTSASVVVSAFVVKELGSYLPNKVEK